ncbi:EAL domain-containing protein [Leucobacter sp. W1153]|uniref:sensor domain-containing protein n=1 Tax=Leucobacter sp. W1153 TaxID=3439064 RepID=UPI003F3EA466
MQGETNERESGAQTPLTRDAQRALIDSIPGVYFVYDSEFKLVEWNQGYLDAVGISEDECFGRGTTTDIAVEDHERAIQSINELATVGHTKVRAHMVHSKTGKRTPFYFSSHTVPEGDGFRIVGLGVDITQTVEVENALRRETALLQTVLESSVDGYVVFDRDRVLIAHNRYFLSDGLFDEDPLFRQVTPEWLALIAQRMEEPGTFLLDITRTLDHPQERHRFVFRQLDGRTLECNANPVIDDAGEWIGQLLSYHDVTELELAQRRYQHLATHDEVTGILNRTALFASLENLITIGEPFGLIAIDVDRFQRYNHTYGHLFGDTVLRLIGKHLSLATGYEHMVGRHGGDEFLILVPGVSTEEQLAEVAESILRQFSTVTTFGERELDLRLHMGICIFPQDGRTVAELITHSDYAMTKQKTPGRNTYTFYTEMMGTELSHRIALERQLRHAIASSAFDLAYQPKVDIVSGQITGIEALLRWHDPDLGWISPENFIPLAEETRLILPLGAWVLATVCAQSKKWLDQGICRVPIAVNVSMIQFFESDFVDTIERILHDTGLEGKFLEVELTETILAQDPQLLSSIVGRLHELGIAVAIDDFGTGYSSLSYLKDFQVDKLKIDKAFIQRIHHSEEDDAIVQTAISIARSLGLITVAEGVETVEQLNFLRASGCLRAQGYIFSRPVSAQEIERIFTDERRGVLAPQPLPDESRTL